MRVLIVNQYFYPDEAATAQLLTDFVRVAQTRGCECRVITSDRSYADSQHRYTVAAGDDPCPTVRVRISGFGRASKIGRAIDYAWFIVGAAKALFLAPRPDVIVGLSTPPLVATLTVLVGRLRGIPSVYWTMDLFPDLAFALGVLNPRSLLSRAFTWVSRWTLRNADLVLALDEAMADKLKAHGARRVVVSHNWANDELIVPAEIAENAFRRDRGWSDRLVVLYSGNLGMAHDVETVLGAAARLADEPRVLFVFAGTGVRRAEVERAVAEHQLVNTEFLPPVPRTELGNLLGAGDIHLVTLRNRVEGLLVPSKIYGSLAAARPLLYIGPPAGEAYAVASEGCGWTVAVNDVDRLVTILRESLADPGERRRRGLAGRQRFEQHHSHRQRVAHLIDCLAESLSVAPTA